ncbi:MAG: RNA polymerase factor sigma-54 [Bacillota bacterium]
MRLDYNLKLEQTQRLIMTPELKLAITLLQYSTQELQDHIQDALLNNPALEVVEQKESDKNGESENLDEATSEKSQEEEFPWEEYFRDMGMDSSFYSMGKTVDKSEYQSAIENCAGTEGSMVEDLLGQLRLLSISRPLYSVAAFLAGNLDQNGYLQGDFDELASALGVSLEELEEGLYVLQKLEPAGIGCRNLQECLMLQLKRAASPPPLALDLVNCYLPAAADGRYRYISAKLNCTEEAVKEAVEFIRTLNPKPGSIFGEGEKTRYITPDVTVEKVEDQYVIMNNESNIPPLTISPFYQQMLKSEANDEQLKTFVKNKIEKAFWLIRSIEQRRQTLFNVSQQIVDIQKPFLDHGIKKLKPLTLKDVAVGVGVHESTVSRATANKFIQTPRGLLPLKFFFSSGFAGRGDFDHTSHSIKSYIKEMIEDEDHARPFSDQRLVELLNDKGVKISRRTVAKYREELSIPASYKRKNLSS